MEEKPNEKESRFGRAVARSFSINKHKYSLFVGRATTSIEHNKKRQKLVFRYIKESTRIIHFKRRAKWRQNVAGPFKLDMSSLIELRLSLPTQKTRRKKSKATASRPRWKKENHKSDTKDLFFSLAFFHLFAVTALLLISLHLQIFKAALSPGERREEND